MGSHRFGDLRAAVTHGAIPEAGDAVDVLLAGVVPQSRALTANQADEVGLGGFAERVEEGSRHGCDATWRDSMSGWFSSLLGI